jgi:hypothetical protein
MTSKKELQYIFNGFQNTPKLWHNDTVFALHQFPYDLSTQIQYEPPSGTKRLRLGKWVEQFVKFQLESSKSITQIYTGLQIRHKQNTIGELDALFLWENRPVHLEIVYKFYLFDRERNGNEMLSHWIGPNRNDSLLFKLNKLKNHQLPLIYKDPCRNVVASKGISTEDIKQFVLFKAKLFTPYEQNFNLIEPLNAACICGTYLNYKELNVLRHLCFYIPSKLEWITTPSLEVNWISFEKAYPVISESINKKRSPLIWTLDSNRALKSFFITWW